MFQQTRRVGIDVDLESAKLLRLRLSRHVINKRCPSTVWCCYVFVMLSSMLCSVNCQVIRSVRFSFTEEQPIGSVVGQIPTTSGLRYRFSQNSTLFGLDSSTGILTSKARVDRDVMSSDNVDLLVQSIPSSELIQVCIDEHFLPVL